jgi:hypothetical protein
MTECPDWIERVRPPSYYLIRAGSAEQRFRDAFARGAHDALRECQRQCCDDCRPKISAIDRRYPEVV